MKISADPANVGNSQGNAPLKPEPPAIFFFFISCLQTVGQRWGFGLLCFFLDCSDAQPALGYCRHFKQTFFFWTDDPRVALQSANAQLPSFKGPHIAAISVLYFALHMPQWSNSVPLITTLLKTKQYKTSSPGIQLLIHCLPHSAYAPFIWQTGDELKCTEWHHKGMVYEPANKGMDILSFKYLMFV